MKITEIESVCTKKPIPFPEQWRPAWLEPEGPTLTGYHVRYLKVHTDEGIIGLGPHYGAPDETVRSYLIGSDPFMIEKFFYTFMNSRENHQLRVPYAGLEIALWDIVGKALNTPVYRLLGAHSDRVLPYAATNRLLTIEEHIQQAMTIKDLGFKALKLRLHRPDPQADLEVVQAVRQTVGKDFLIAVDTNQNNISPGYAHWSQKIALNVCRALDELGVYFVEEPRPMWDVEGLADIRAATNLYIAGGEHAGDFRALLPHLNHSAYDILQTDVILGDNGISGLRKSAILADSFGKQVIPHVTIPDSYALCLAATLQAAATLSNCPMIEYLWDPPVCTSQMVQFYVRDQILPDTDGYLNLPDKPGLGIEINEEKLAKYL
jgi:L-alanine-DL-glutamate epimerase-like enolase superfamily enzyme